MKRQSTSWIGRIAQSLKLEEVCRLEVKHIEMLPFLESAVEASNIT
jgi:hypothetical protein